MQEFLNSAAFDSPANLLAPKMAGAGEAARAQIVADLLQKWVLKTYCMLIARMTAFPAAIAPILLPVSRAAHRRDLWIFGHLDTVGAGDLSAWHHDPGRYARLAILLWARGGGQSASCLFHVDSLPKVCNLPALCRKLVLVWFYGR